MIVVGVNAPPRGWHDSAACLVIDGTVVAFGEEERFTRRKHGTHQPPHRAVAHCLAEAGLALDDVDVVAVGWGVETISTWQGAKSRPFNARTYASWVLGRSLSTPARPELVFVPHHLAHATCGFFASPFESAAVLVVDGIGDDESVSIWAARSDGALRPLRRWPPTASLGLLYDAACQAVGLGGLEGGKLMGLSAFGRHIDGFAWPLVDFNESDDYQLCLPVSLAPDADVDAVISAWRATFGMLADGMSVRATRDALHLDSVAVRTAWSAQHCVEQVVELLCSIARREAGSHALCLAGGVALNCAANGRISEPVYVPPLAHDAGVALGAAWHVCPPRGPRAPLSPYLGLRIPNQPGSSCVRDSAARWGPFDPNVVVERLLRGEVGGIVDGRAEVGPRALGHRSIVALPRPRTQQDKVNAMKGREPWRPFAPVASPAYSATLWEQRPHLHRYMLGASGVADSASNVIAAAMHVDGTTRPQTLYSESGGTVVALLDVLQRQGLPPVLLNTSFNGPGEPIVNDIEHAEIAFTTLGLDFLVVGEVMGGR